MATKLWHVPVRLATGAIILDQGLLKLDADEDNVEGYAAGGTAVVIGSVDTGADFVHPEFAPGS